MKTRSEIYGREAASLLQTVTMYPGLLKEQLFHFYPGKEDITKSLLFHLERQGRIFQNEDGRYFPAGQPAQLDLGLIKAVWVLLDFIGQAEYHAPADFPIKLVFFTNGELYEIAYTAEGQEALVNHALRNNRSGSSRILLVDNPVQISKIDCPGIAGFCTVDPTGRVQYFKKGGI